MNTNKTKALLYFNYLFGVLLLTVAQSVFPDRYFLDSEGIKIAIPGSTFQFDFLDSFNNTAYFYKILGFGTVMPNWLAGFVSYSIPFIYIGLICRQQKWEFNSITALLFSVWNVLLAVYLGVYSKELLAFWILASLMLLAKSRMGFIIGITLALFYAAFFRVYWVLVVGFFFVNLWAIRSKKSLLTLVALQVIAAFFVFKLANMATGQYLSDARLNVNTEREDGSEAATMIDNYLSNSSSIHDWLNGTLLWLSLIFPFFLLKTAEIQHLIFFIFQIGNILLFIRVAQYLMRQVQYSPGAFSKNQKFQIEMAIAWCISYSFVQGIFEPDFGSFAKHQVILVPMWFSLLSVYFKSKKSFFSHWQHSTIGRISPVPGSINQ